MAEQECVIPTKEMLDDFETVELAHDGDFATAQRMAWSEAEQRRQNPMMLAWWDGKARQYSPDTSCAGYEQPAWMKYARANGSDLAVTVNDNEYVFLFRGIEGKA
jgi:alpha-glucuronidase